MMTTTEKQFTCGDCQTSGSTRWMLSHNCSHNQYVRESGGRCEDYPCCGHTDGDGCYALESHTSEYWMNNPHLHCDHEAGVCDAYNDDYDEEPDPNAPHDCNEATYSYDENGPQFCEVCDREVIL